MMTSLGPWHKVFLVVVVAFLIVPTLIVIPMSFSSGTTFQFPPPGWSLRWWERLFDAPQWRMSVLNSLKVGLVAAPLATVIGTAAAFGLTQLTPQRRRVMLGLVIAPLIIPKILIALAVYGSFLTLRLNGTLTGIALAHTAVVLPYVVIAVMARLQNHDENLAEAGRTLGAGPVSVFRKITLPLVMPGIVSGAALAFVVSLDELVIALFLQAPDVITLPVIMFTSVVYNIDLTVAAASTFFVIAVSLVIFFGQVITIRRGNRPRSGM